MKICALDEDGKPVDWWFLYKVPKLTKDASHVSATGYEYVYYDPQVGKVTRSYANSSATRRPPGRSSAAARSSARSSGATW